MAARLVLLAGVLALSACSIAGPSDRAFVTTQPTLAAISAQPVNKPGNKPNPNKDKAKTQTPPTEDAAMKSASAACKNQARDKGIKSLLAIVSHLRPGAVDADYVTCMQSKGYDVAK